MKKENIPNILTIIRFILIPFIFTSVVNKDFLATIIIFTISAITDVLDGYIARKYNYITDIIITHSLINTIANIHQGKIFNIASDNNKDIWVSLSARGSISFPISVI